MSAPSKASPSSSSPGSPSTIMASFIKWLPMAVALIFAVAIISATPALSENCYVLPKAECNQTANCTFLMSCQGCVPAPCDWFTDQASCPTERCGWNGTLGACFDGEPECFQRTTEAQCNDDAPECTWDGDSQYCLETMDHCYWLEDEPTCDNDTRCAIFDGVCYAVHRVPKCEEIHSISACYIVDGCGWEGLNGACFNESEDAVCSTLGQNEIVCEYYAPKCTFNETYGCLSASLCEDPSKEAATLVYSFDTGFSYWESDLNDSLIEHPTAGEVPPFVIFGNSVTANTTGLQFDGGCISLGQFEGLTFSSGATIGIDTLHDTLNSSRTEVLLDLSSNGHDLVLTKGPYNALTLFGRQRDRLTVIDSAYDVLSDFTSITLAAGKSHAMVYVNSTLTLHGPWTGGLVKFTGALRVGCSSTEDNVWYGELQKLFIFTGLSSSLQNTSSTLPTEPPRVTSADL